MRTWILVMGLSMTLASGARGQSLLEEGFDDGNRDGWFLTSGGEVTVADDAAGLGTGKALALATHAGSSQRRLLANFKAVELSKPGDALVLRFDYRITGNPDASRGRGDAEGGFRFGFFDSRGTLQTADNPKGPASANAADDVGYLAMTSVGVPKRARLIEEKGEDGNFMGGTDLQYLQTDDNFGGVDDSVKHSAVFTITRVSDAAMTVELAVDGRKKIRAEVTGGLRSRFDEVAFAASHRAADFRVDNIEVTSGASAPPSTSGNRAPSVQARCAPCTIEVGKDTVLTAEVRDAGGRPVTYQWSASTGKFSDPTARQTSWTGPMRKGWSEERWRGGGGVPITVTIDDGRGGTAAHTVTVDVVKAAGN
jgi:hypothetical protein